MEILNLLIPLAVGEALAEWYRKNKNEVVYE